MSEKEVVEVSSENEHYPLVTDYWDGESLTVINKKYVGLLNCQDSHELCVLNEENLGPLNPFPLAMENARQCTSQRQRRMSQEIPHRHRSVSDIPQQLVCHQESGRRFARPPLLGEKAHAISPRTDDKPRCLPLDHLPSDISQGTNAVECDDSAGKLRQRQTASRNTSGTRQQLDSIKHNMPNKKGSRAKNPDRLVSPFQKKNTVNETPLYVRLHDVINDIDKLGDLLTAKVDREGVEFRPTEGAIQRSETCTYCLLNCPSKALAKKLRTWLLKDRQKFTPLIDCSLDPFDQDVVRKKDLGLKKELLKKQVIFELNARSEQVLRAHNQKLEEVLDKADKAKQNLHDLYKYKETKREIEALEQKQSELENQKEEFKRALAGFTSRLTKVLEVDSFETELKNFQRQFGVECARMEKPLPVFAHRQKIVEQVKNNQVSVIVAETGSGKSTQIVQYLLETDLVNHGIIVCTQPRKVAAVSLAMHVAKELATSVGKAVGYKVGSLNKRSVATKVIFTTDHSLLSECLNDPDLKQFSCIVVDEAHERSLYTDLLLGMVKRCLKTRPDLRVIITSATIDPEVFVQFFGGICPVMKISGRTFPVEVVWEDADCEENDFEDYENEAVKKAIEIHMKEPPGDILVFLTSRVETEKCCESFGQRMRDRSDFQCFPLHGQLQPAEQQKVFEPLAKNKRKIIFATNCAETSITIDGIKYVVDTGVAKEMRYDAKKNVNRLSVTIVSKSSADQRKGRAGRTAPGKCYRLYSQRSYNAMEAISLPEILKTHLGQALLKLAELGIGPDMYDFVQSPGPDAIDAALVSLVQLGAMENGKITETGRWMARLPFDPKLGLLTLLGKDEDILYDAIVLSAVINAGSGVFYRGTTQESQNRQDKAKSKFSSTGGDFLTSLEVYKKWQTVPEKQKNKWCIENSVNAKTMRGVRENINEVAQILRKELRLDIEHSFSESESASEMLRKMIFRCYCANLCHYLGKEKAGYFAAHACRQVHVHPSSSQNALASFPEWVVYNELIETSRDFITGLTPVDDSWLKEISAEKFGFDIEEIRSKKVLNVLTVPAGSHAFFALIGPRYSKMRTYEEQVTDSAAVVIIEASRERGEIKVFSVKTVDSVRDLTQTLNDTTQAAVKELQKEDREVFIGREASQVRVILGLGGQVSDILMPNESRKVFVVQPSDDATEETITHKFQHFGEIRFCKQFAEGRNWGIVIFRSVEEAIRAAKLTKDDDRDIGQLERRRPAKQNADFKARLSWCRRPSRGFGFVEVSPLYLSDCLKKGHFDIGYNTVKIRLDRKKDDSLYLTGLPAEVTEDVVKRSLLYAVFGDENAADIVTSVNIVRAKVGKTTEKELKQLEKQIRESFEGVLNTSTVQVNVKKPDTDHKVRFLAEAYFSDPVEGIKACRALRNFHLNNGQRVEVTPIISATLTVQQRVLDSCQQQYQRVVDRLSKRGVEVVLKPQKLNVLVSIKALDLEDTVKARTFLSDVFKGDVLDCSTSPSLQHLLTPAGRKFLQEAEKKTGAYVCVDNRLRTIAIHGSDQACTKARIEMNDYLDLVLSGTIEEVTLKGSNNPPGLLKALITKYGDDLDNFRCAMGLHSITVDYRRHKLKLIGAPDNLKQTRDQIQQLKDELWEACKESKPEEDDIECSACFCPIDVSELYRLEICAHPYCKGCIKRQVTVAIGERKLPVVCCYDGCDLPLAWRDFSNMIRVGEITLSSLASAALSAFVLANRDVAHFCTTPDCPMVYRVSSEDDAKVFQCPECGVRTCTACHLQSHDGVTCAMLRSSKNQEQDVEEWARQDRKRRRVCPGCRSPIEKIGGCNKMHCGACNTIFCWHCLEKFRIDKDCYDHLTKKHGGIFALEDILY